MQKLGLFWKIKDIFYKIGTELFKIEKEITEKIKFPPSSNKTLYMAIFVGTLQIKFSLSELVLGLFITPDEPCYCFTRDQLLCLDLMKPGPI